jgi:dGTPase
VVETLEQRYPNYDGINLSWEIRESMIKHKTTYDQPKLNELYKPEWQPLLEAQIVDAADTIAYDNHDLDDGIRSGLINEADLSNISLWKKSLSENKSKLKTNNHSIYRSQVIIYMINMEITDIISNTSKLLDKYKIESVEDVRKSKERIVNFSDEMLKYKKELQTFLYEHLYTHYRVLRMTQKAKHFIERIFTTYSNNPKQLPSRYQIMLPKNDKYRVICDYIAGMTDRYLQEEYQKLYYPFERM